MFNQTTKDDWTTTFEDIKVQCSHVVKCLISKFEHWFPSQELMNVTSIIYPQYWLNPLTKKTFHGHLKLLKVHFCFKKVIDPYFDQMKILALFDEVILNLGTSLFKIIIQRNHATTLKLLFMCNLVIWLWFKFASNSFLQN